jgi:hypothetical protein
VTGPREQQGSREAREPREPREPDWERRKRRAEIFGDVLPESTRDDRDTDGADRRGGGRPGEGVGERWLRDQVPPHHGS